MGFDPSTVRVITFDSFSTLVDPASAGRVLEGYVEDPPTVAKRWHGLAVWYATALNHVAQYLTYYDLHRVALEVLLRDRGYDPDRATLEEMTDVYHDLEPFEDVREGMDRLTEAGYRLAILSNGDPAMLDSLVETTALSDVIEMAISADEIRTFKPDRRLYHHAADRLDVPPAAIAHVGAGWGDMLGCMHADMGGIWLNRGGDPWPAFGIEPAVEAASMDDVLAAFAEAS